MGDDARDPDPAPVLLIGEVGGGQHALGAQPWAQQRQRRAVRRHSGQAQVCHLLLATGHGRQGRGDGACDGARKRGLEPCTPILVGGSTASAVLIR